MRGHERQGGADQQGRQTRSGRHENKKEQLCGKLGASSRGSRGAKDGVSLRLMEGFVGQLEPKMELRMGGEGEAVDGRRKNEMRGSVEVVPCACLCEALVAARFFFFFFFFFALLFSLSRSWSS